MGQRIYGLGLFASLFIAACSTKVQFGSLPSQLNQNNNLCVPTNTLTTRLTKILFLVDTSGSNVGLGCTPTPTDPCLGTDPVKKFRLGSIGNFFKQYSAKTNIQWGFVTFAGTTATPLVASNGIATFSNAASMQSAVTQFASVVDIDNTPYLAAMAAASQAIANDPDRNTKLNPQYIVVMLTDGYPSDIQAAGDASNSLGQMLASAPGEVSFSTIFYGPEQNAGNAIALLSSLAQAGGGQFADVNTSPNGVKIDDVIKTSTCQ